MLCPKVPSSPYKKPRPVTVPQRSKNSMLTGTAIAETFLRAVLPANGLKVAAVFEGGKPKHYFINSIEELAQSLLAWDGMGKTVYHGCASYTEGTRRTQENVAGLKAFWCDLDAGEGKPYPDAPSAWQALMETVRQLSLPLPLVVGSGYGVHAYWPLTEALTRIQWQPIAEGFKHALVKAGLAIDPARTADAASILRTPGTHNRKRAPVPVSMGEVPPPSPVEAFMRFAAPVPARAMVARGAKPAWLEAATNTGDGPPSDPLIMATNCAQVAALRDSHGNLPEPLWYAVLGALAFCEGGGRHAHLWSSGHPNYTQAETQTRLDRAKDLTGPTTCAKLAALNPDACAACPFNGKVITPTQVGRPSAPKPVAHSPAVEALFAAQPPADYHGVALPPLQDPFAWGAGGEVVLVTENNTGKPITRVACAFPFFLATQHVSEATGHDASLHFKYYLPHEGWQDVTIPAAVMQGMGALSALGRARVYPVDKLAFQEYVKMQMNQNLKARASSIRYDQFGWKGQDFFAGQRLYSGGEVLPAMGGDLVRNRAQRMQPAGDANKWAQALNALFLNGSEAHIFAVLCSFAAPLMRFHGENEGGAIVSLVSAESARAKSTALYAAGSVWGHWRSMEFGTEDTRVARGKLLGVHGNLPILVDELVQKMKQDDLRELTAIFTNGRDKNRGNQDGGLQSVEATWQTIMLTASNRSLVDAVTTTNVDAMGFRVLEFPVPKPQSTISHADGDAIRRGFEVNYGHAGDLFLQYLTRPDVFAWMREALEAEHKQLITANGFRSEHRFWTRTLSAVRVASAIVKSLGIITLDLEHVNAWALRQTLAAKGEALVLAGEVDTSGTEALSQFLLEHVGEMLTIPAYNRLPMKGISVRYELQAQRVYVSERKFRAWLRDHEYNIRTLLQDLSASGVLKTARQRFDLTKGADLPTTMLTVLDFDVSAMKLPALAEAGRTVVPIRSVGPT